MVDDAEEAEAAAFLASTRAPDVLEILMDYQAAVAALNACMADPSKTDVAQEYANLCYDLEEEVRKVGAQLPNEGERQE